MIPVFRGSVHEGKLRLDDRPSFDEWAASLNGKQVSLTLKQHRATRSSNQNRYLHGVVFKMIADAAGYTLDEAKDALKWEFLRVHGEGPLPTVRKTSKLNTAEMTEFIENCRRLGAETYGMDIPDPNAAVLPEYDFEDAV